MRDNWSGSVPLSITPVTGTAESLRNLSNTPFLTPDSYKEFQNSIYAVKEIGVPAKYTVSCSFRDQNAPTFDNGTPIFTVGDSSASIDIQLNRPNTRFYYVVTQVGKISTTLNDKTVITADNGNWDKLPKNGEGLTAGNVELPPRRCDHQRHLSEQGAHLYRRHRPLRWQSANRQDLRTGSQHEIHCLLCPARRI